MNEDKLKEDEIIKPEKTPVEKAIFKSACIVLPIASIISVIEIIRYINWQTDQIYFVIPLGIVLGCAFIIFDSD